MSVARIDRARVRAALRKVRERDRIILLEHAIDLLPDADLRLSQQVGDLQAIAEGLLEPGSSSRRQLLQKMQQFNSRKIGRS